MAAGETSKPERSGSMAGSGQMRREALRRAAQRSGPPSRSASGVSGAVEADGDTQGDATPVFVSYAREDVAVVQELVARLRRSGVGVSWDRDFIGGVDFRRQILSAITAARSVIVVWSDASVASHFVLDEAGLALRSSKLVTTHVDGFDLDEVPLGFQSLHVIPVDGWELIHRSLAEHGVLAAA